MPLKTPTKSGIVFARWVDIFILLLSRSSNLKSFFKHGKNSYGFTKTDIITNSFALWKDEYEPTWFSLWPYPSGNKWILEELFCFFLSGMIEMAILWRCYVDWKEFLTRGRLFWELHSNHFDFFFLFRWPRSVRWSIPLTMTRYMTRYMQRSFYQ